MATRFPPPRRDFIDVDVAAASPLPGVAPRSGMAPRGTADLAEQLLAAGLITREDGDRALAYVRWRRVRLEDALIELSIVCEADLLRFIATRSQTRFVSAEKLAQATIAPQLLERVPAKAAEFCAAFPVMFDDATGTLTVVTADPGDPVALHEIRVASAGVRRVVALAARPAAVRAAIDRHYKGDRWAFRALSRPTALDDYVNAEVVLRAGSDG